jgi:hypothetical protein
MESKNQKLLKQYFSLFRTLTISRSISFSDGIMFLTQLQVFSNDLKSRVIDKKFTGTPFTEAIFWREVIIAISATITLYALSFNLEFDDDDLESDLLKFFAEKDQKKPEKPNIIIKKPELWN